MHMNSHTDIHYICLSIYVYIVFFGNIIKLHCVALQGLITFLVNENGFNSDRVTKVCRALYSIIILDCFSRISICSSENFK